MLVPQELLQLDINLLKKHKVKKIELFDQFPNKKHLEIVSILEKI